MVCINFNGVIESSRTADSRSDPVPVNPLVCQVPSQMWSVNEHYKLDKKVVTAYYKKYYNNLYYIYVRINHV